MTEISRRFDTTGKVVSESRLLFAARENGSIMSVDLGTSGRGVRQIIDTAAQRIILINPNSRWASEAPYRWIPAMPPCDQRFYHIVGAAISIDKSSTRGDHVSVQHISLELPDGLTKELLLAPSLGCRVLQSRTLHRGRVIATVISQNLNIGNPDPALFEVPPGYRVDRMPIP